MKVISSKLVQSAYRSQRAKPADWQRRDVSEPLFQIMQYRTGGPSRAADLVKLPPTPDIVASCGNVYEFRRNYWAAEMWSKFPFDIGVDRRSVAYATFLESEAKCAEVNCYLADGWSRPWPTSLRYLLERARRNISRLLGDVNLEEIVQMADWGPGASTSLRSHQAQKPNKWELGAHATFRALPYVLAYRKWAGLEYVTRDPIIVEGNNVTTVPKNAKTDRVIAIEPDWNMFFQLGVGRALRRRLNRVGLLVEDPWKNAQVLNQQLAKLGARDNTYGTLDLRAASDTVSLALCELLLPTPWLRLLLDLRSPVGQLADRTIVYEKISSMGNGTTFELETLIFWGLSSALQEGGAIVYGDDIIVENRDIGLQLIELLEFCGFEVNRQKTFLDGPFRESCGGHFWYGTNVTPPYVRKPVDSMPRYIAVGNTLQERATTPSGVELLQDAWQFIASRVPRTLRGPRSAGNICLWDRFSRCVPSYSKDLQCFCGPGLEVTRPSDDWSGSFGAYLTSLKGDATARSRWQPELAREEVRTSRWISARWEDDTLIF